MARHKTQASAEKALTEQKEGEQVTTVSAAPLAPLPEHGPSAATAAAAPREAVEKGPSKGAAIEAAKKALESTMGTTDSKPDDSAEVASLKAMLADAQAALKAKGQTGLTAEDFPNAKPFVERFYRILQDKKITGDNGYRATVRAGTEFSNISRNPRKLERMGVKIEEIKKEDVAQL